MMTTQIRDTLMTAHNATSIIQRHGITSKCEFVNTNPQAHNTLLFYNGTLTDVYSNVVGFFTVPEYSSGYFPPSAPTVPYPRYYMVTLVASESRIYIYDITSLTHPIVIARVPTYFRTFTERCNVVEGLIVLINYQITIIKISDILSGNLDKKYVKQEGDLAYDDLRVNRSWGKNSVQMYRPKNDGKCRILTITWHEKNNGDIKINTAGDTYSRHYNGDDWYKLVSTESPRMWYSGERRPTHDISMDVLEGSDFKQYALAVAHENSKTRHEYKFISSGCTIAFINIGNAFTERKGPTDISIREDISG